MAFCACPAILISASSLREGIGGAWFETSMLRLPQDVICAAVPTRFTLPRHERLTGQEPRSGQTTLPSSFDVWCSVFHERVLNARGRDLQMEIEPHLSRVVGQLLASGAPVRLHCATCRKDYSFRDDYGRGQSSGVGRVEVFHLSCPQGHPLVSIGAAFGPPSPITTELPSFPFRLKSRPFSM
jgi:hypothetical protein